MYYQHQHYKNLCLQYRNICLTLYMISFLWWEFSESFIFTAYCVFSMYLKAITCCTHFLPFCKNDKKCTFLGSFSFASAQNTFAIFYAVNFFHWLNYCLFFILAEFLTSVKIWRKLYIDFIMQINIFFIRLKLGSLSIFQSFFA